MNACPCGAERPCMSPMIRCDHPMRRPSQPRMTATLSGRDAMEWLADIVAELEGDESIGIPPHVPLLIEALRGVLTAGDPRTPTPDGHATCPRCEQKARTA